MRERLQFVIFLVICVVLLGCVVEAVRLGADEMTEASVEPVTVKLAAPTTQKTEKQVEKDSTQVRESSVEVHKIENVIATHYDCCDICCGKSDGITASGRLAVPYRTVAVPPEIPLGAVIFLAYPDGRLVEYQADDRGGAIEGARIDICVQTHEEALELGVEYGCTLYWYFIEEEAA